MGLFAAFLLLCLGCPALAFDPPLELSQYKHTKWTADDGAPTDVQVLAQSPDGFLWIGAGNGLYRFDGKRFERMPGIGNGDLRRERVTALLFTRSGDLWVGYATGRVGFIRRGRAVDVTGSDMIWIRKLFEDRTGRVWMESRNYSRPLAYFQNGHWMNVSFPGETAEETGIDMIQAADSSLWLYERRIYRARPGETIFEDVGEMKPTYHGLIPDSSGRVWVVTPKGPLPVGQPQTHAAIPAAAPASLSHGFRRAIFDRSGNIWILFNRKTGVFRLAHTDGRFGSAGKWSSARFSNGLSSDLANAIMEDREGNIWVGTSQGLDRFRRGNAVLETAIAPNSPMGYLLVAGRHGAVFAADSNTAYRISPGRAPEPILRNLDNPEALCEGDDGTVWLAASSPKKIRAWRSGRSEWIARPDKGDYLGCVVDEKGALWLTRVGGGLFRYHEGRWETFPRFANDAKHFIEHLVRDPSGGLLATDRSGHVLHLDYPRMRVEAKVPPGYGWVNALAREPAGTLLGGWFGLARPENNSVRVVGRDAGSLGSISGMTTDLQGDLWTIGGDVVSRIPKRRLWLAITDPDASLEPEHFDTLDGIPGSADDFYAGSGAATGGDGRLWFITQEGIVRVDPSHLRRNALPPQVSVTQIFADGKSMAHTGAANLPKGTSRLEIDFTAPSLSIPERVRFRYRLEGYDKTWVDPGNSRQAFYTGLPPGRYVFRAKAANESGVWSRVPVSLPLRLPPTFLQSIWFKLLCVTAVILALLAAYNLRVRMLTARLRTKLEARLVERERIARELHDTLLQSVQGLIFRFQTVGDKVPAESGLKRLLTDALDRAESLLVEGRQRVRELRARSSRGDLPARLEELASQFAEGRPTRFALTIEGHERPLEPLVRDEVEAVAIEAMRNSFEHAKASLVEVAIGYHRAEYRLGVRDDGVGLPREIAEKGERAGHFGLTGMKERAGRIGGRLDLSSARGAGTQVLLSVPARRAYTPGTQRRSGWRRPAADYPVRAG